MKIEFFCRIYIRHFHNGYIITLIQLLPALNIGWWEPGKIAIAVAWLYWEICVVLTRKTKNSHISHIHEKQKEDN